MWLRPLLIGLAVLLCSCGLGADGEPALSPQDRERLVDAAIAHAGGGEVVEIEDGDEGGVYGVEVELPDGTRLDVELDSDFTVVNSSVDND